MLNHLRTERVLAALLFAVSYAAMPAAAAITVYTDATLFQSDTGAGIVATFEGRSTGATLSFTEGAVHFAAHAPLSNLYIIGVGAGATNPTPTSKCLTGNGADDIDVTPPAGTYGVGFDTITNAYAAPVVTVYAPDNSIMGTLTLSQAPNTRGFFGVHSTSPIGSLRWSATNGHLQNTTIDNVRVTMSPVPVAGASWGAVKSIFR